MTRPPPTALFVANFPPNTGYAWDFIEGLYAKIGDRIAGRGVRSLVAYPTLDSYPESLAGSTVEPLPLKLDLSSPGLLRRFALTARKERVELLYLTDRPSRSLAFPYLRRAGIRTIVVHDHTSGHRPAPGVVRRSAKRTLNRVPGMLADVIITVSDYVARRQREVVQAPAARIVRVYNGVPIPAEAAVDAHRSFDIDPSRPIIACACRAHPVKGVHHLLRAFDRVASRRPRERRPVLLYVGDGPQRAELEALRETLTHPEDIVMAGFVPEADSKLGEVEFFVVPSVWQDALPLSVMQPMARGQAVIASNVGGIPEMIEDGASGLLVPPGDEAALADAMRRLLDEPQEARRLGASARRRIAERFRPEDQLGKLVQIVESGLGIR